MGIIGVVAAMTMPVLMQNHKKIVTSTRLKKAYNTVSNAIRLSENDNGPMSDWPQGENMNVEEFWNVYLNPYLNGARKCKNMTECGYPKDLVNIKWTGEGNWNLASYDSRVLFQLNDGTVVFFPRNTYTGEGENAYVSSLFIDINGNQFPNEAGRDVFYFDRDYQNGRITAPKGDCATRKRYCTYLIMSNSWQIPDDYPYKL